MWVSGSAMELFTELNVIRARPFLVFNGFIYFPLFLLGHSFSLKEWDAFCFIFPSYGQQAF